MVQPVRTRVGGSGRVDSGGPSPGCTGRPASPSSISAPALVVGLERGEGMLNPAVSRFIANRIPRARLVLTGDQTDTSDVGWWHW